MILTYNGSFGAFYLVIVGKFLFANNNSRNNKFHSISKYPNIHLFVLLATYNISSLVFKEGQELYLHAVAVNKNKNTSPDTKNFGKKLKIATASKN